MRVQAYIELDAEDRTEEQEEAFQAFCSHYLMSQYLIGSKYGREYYHCLLVDADNIPEMVSLMSARHPVVNGCWTTDSVMYNAGMYKFDLELHLKYTPDEVVNEVSTPVTWFKPLHGFLGWDLPTQY